MNIDKGKLIKNLIIFVIIAVVCTVISVTSMDIGIGDALIGGVTIALVIYLPVRMFPQVGLLGSIIILVVEVVIVMVVLNLLGDTLGAIAVLILLLAAFIASLLFL